MNMRATPQPRRRERPQDRFTFAEIQEAWIEGLEKKRQLRQMFEVLLNSPHSLPALERSVLELFHDIEPHIERTMNP